MFPLIMGIVAGALSGFSALASAENRRNQQRAQAYQMEAQAQRLRQQSELERRKGENEAYQIDRRKSEIRRKFQELQGHNRSLLGAGNVDMTSGSALDVSYGNIDRFADDMGENAYQRAVKLWEGQEAEKSLRYQADVADANSSYLKKTAGSIGTSLLTALISGGSGFAGGYTMAGGNLGSLFSSEATNIWDKPAVNGIMMRHPSGRWAYAPKIK